MSESDLIAQLRAEVTGVTLHRQRPRGPFVDVAVGPLVDALFSITRPPTPKPQKKRRGSQPETATESSAATPEAEWHEPKGMTTYRRPS